MEALTFPVLLELVPSRWLRAFLLVVHGLAAMGGLFSPWPLLGQILFFLILAGNFCFTLRALARAPKRIILAADGRFRLPTSTSGDAPENLLLARPRPGALVLPWLVVFSWRGEESSACGTLVLLADSFLKKTDGADNLRRLNIWLRWSPASGN